MGNPRNTTSSQLGATLTQPLLRNGGYKVTMENLTQAERNLLYALRDFTQYRKDFTLQVVSAYYGVLRNRDALRNSWAGYQSFKASVARKRAFVDEGQGLKADLGRFQQDELSNEAAWISAVRSYKQSLDLFKVQQLGLPSDTRIVLDDKDLGRLTIVTPTFGMEDAIRVALFSRLDFYTTRDKFEDTARKIALAVNGLLPDLDLILGVNVPSKPGNGLPELDLSRATWSGEMKLNLPLDRKAERNTYRAALISYDQAKRTLELTVDNIKLDIYDSWRRLDEAQRTYESSEIAVKIAEQRVAEQNLLEELGRGLSEEKSNAQNALTDSLNRRTSALVGHTTARLSLWRAMGVLNIKDNGQWEEVTNLKTN
jgi:outer membrane protein TolC